MALIRALLVLQSLLELQICVRSCDLKPNMMHISFHPHSCRSHLGRIRSSCLGIDFLIFVSGGFQSPSFRSLVLKAGFLGLHHPSSGSCFQSRVVTFESLVGSGAEHLYLTCCCPRASLRGSLFLAPCVVCFVCSVCGVPVCVCVWSGAVLPGS